jgi:hypothetical protein
MSPYEPTVVESYGSWELVEGISGRALRRRRVGPVKPHLLIGIGAVAFGAWMNLTGELPDEPAAVVIGFGLLVVILGTRFSSRSGRELRLGATELTWATPGEVSGTRWPHSTLSHVELFEPLQNLAPGMARRIKPRFQVLIKTKEGEPLPWNCIVFDRRRALELAQRIADATGLDVRTATGQPGK